MDNERTALPGIALDKLFGQPQIHENARRRDLPGEKRVWPFLEQKATDPFSLHLAAQSSGRFEKRPVNAYTSGRCFPLELICCRQSGHAATNNGDPPLLPHWLSFSFTTCQWDLLGQSSSVKPSNTPELSVVSRMASGRTRSKGTVDL